MNKKLFQLFGNLSGEMKTDGVPLASGVDLEAFKKEDDDFLEVVVEIPAGPSTRGWNYTKFALQSIVDKVMRNTLAGFLGHQKAENVKNEFKPPVTHWIGAKMEGESAFFRGVIDKSATDLKRWIRTGRIKQVSIFGYPKLQTSNGETQVTDYDALSIDWTPLDRAGMPTRIVATSGEMWDLDGNGPNENKGGNKTMNPEELLAKLKEMMSNRQINMSMIAGEMGLTAEQIAGELDNDWLKEVNAAVETLKKVNNALGVTGEMDPVEVAVNAAKALEDAEKAGFQKVLGEMMEAKVTSEAVRKDINDSSTVIGRMWDYHSKNIDASLSKDEIAAEMDSFLNDDIVKGLISNYHTDNPAGLGGGQGNSDTTKHLKTKKVSL